MIAPFRSSASRIQPGCAGQGAIGGRLAKGQILSRPRDLDPAGAVSFGQNGVGGEFARPVRSNRGQIGNRDLCRRIQRAGCKAALSLGRQLWVGQLERLEGIAALLFGRQNGEGRLSLQRAVQCGDADPQVAGLARHGQLTLAGRTGEVGVQLGLAGIRGIQLG